MQIKVFFSVLILFLFCAIASKAAIPPVKKNTTVSVAKGALKIKAGYVLKNGEVRMLADKDLFISKVPFSKFKTRFENADFSSVSSKLIDIDPKMYANPSPECATIVGYSTTFKLANQQVMLLENALNLDAMKSFLDIVIKAGGVPVCSTDLNGACTIERIHPGSYYIISGPIKTGTSVFGWDLPIKIEAGKTTSVELRNSNMADLTPISDQIRLNCGL